jgi:hypothetical protein
MEHFLRIAMSLLVSLSMCPLLAQAAEPTAASGPAAPAFMVSVVSPSQARPARLLVREGQMASYAIDDKAVGITVRAAPSGFASVEVVELREVESIKHGGQGPHYEAKAAIDLRTTALGESWELPGIGLSLAVSAEPLLDASRGGRAGLPR